MNSDELNALHLAILVVGVAIGWGSRAALFHARRYEDLRTWEKAAEYTTDLIITRIVRKRYPELFSQEQA